MFTGIITDVGTIDRIEQRGDLRVIVATGYDMSGVDLGASIACSGVCLTVVDKGGTGGGDALGGWFAADVSGETLSRTAAGQWTEGAKLNLERALKLGEELGGHIVTGHVDGIGEIVSMTTEGGSLRVVVAAGPDIAPFVAPKGSITLDGVSLTVNSVEDEDGRVLVGINLIPHTAAVTTLGSLHAGSPINIEIDVLARYLKRMEHYRGR